MTHTIRVEKFLSTLNNNRKGNWNKQVSFAVKYEQYKELSLHDTILIDHPYSPPAFYKIIGLRCKILSPLEKVCELTCLHEFDAIGYNPPTLNSVFLDTNKFQVGDIVTVGGKNHCIMEIHDENKLTVKQL